MEKLNIFCSASVGLRNLSLLLDLGSHFELWGYRGNTLTKLREWNKEVTPGQAHLDLLVTLFHGNALERYVRTSEWSDIAGEVNFSGSDAEVSFSLMQVLDKHGRLDVQWFQRLVQAFPERDEHVQAAAVQYGFGLILTDGKAPDRECPILCGSLIPSDDLPSTG